MASASQSDAPGLILPEGVYTTEEVQARLRIGPNAIRQAKRDGLRIRKIGRRSVVFGRDLLAFLETNGK